MICVGIRAQSEPDRLAATIASLRRNSPHDVVLALVPDAPDGAVSTVLPELGLPVVAGNAAGGAAALNRLLRFTDAEVAVLLESGCVVEAGWLAPLVAALEPEDRGLAGPTTNRAWNEQAGDPGAHAGAVVSLAPLYSIGDFCLAVHRRTVDAIGGADEGFGIGPCWELEYAARASRAGLETVWATASYVWRAPVTDRRAHNDETRMDAARHHYQDRLCARRLRGGAGGPYREHCRGDDCPNFAPADRIELVVSLDRTPSRPRRPVPPPPRPAVVSAVMPTSGRPEWALQAVAYFERQRGIDAELIVVCDEGDGLAHELAGRERVRCIETPPGTSLGTKRNVGTAAARGEFIAQWDDDDWYGPDRLARQIAPILARRADITGLRMSHLLDVTTGDVWAPSTGLHRRMFFGDVAGGTLVFRRALWLRGMRYPDIGLGEDVGFLHLARRHGLRLGRVDGDGLFICVRHHANTWQLEQDGPGDHREWRRCPPPNGMLGDLAFYAARGDRDRLVSAIMPTADRRAFVPRALDCFAAQDHPRRELIVLDDGEDPVADLMPRDDPRVRYVRLERRHLIGEKRNLACRLAGGPIIANWDDDDWYAPHRLRYQAAELEREKADITGQDRLLFADPQARAAWRYVQPPGARAWVAGSSMCFRRSAWKWSPFPALVSGEDTAFVWRARGRVHAHDDTGLCVAVMHPGATAAKDTGGANWEPRPFAEAVELLGADAERWLS